jgi:thymidylate kinase
MTLGKVMNLSKIIAITGIDGSGKSTQCSYLTSTLNRAGLKTNYVKIAPFQSEKYIQYEKYLNHTASVNQVVDEDIKVQIVVSEVMKTINYSILPKLKDNSLVVCDRYIESLETYLIYKSRLDEFYQSVLASMPKPSMTFLLDVSLDTILVRIANRGECPNKETLDYYQESQRILKMIARREDFIIINAELPIKTISETIFMYIRNILVSSY